MTQMRIQHPLGALKYVRLEWEEWQGHRSDHLPIAKACPECASRVFQRLDVYRRCEHELYRPVRCLACSEAYAVLSTSPVRRYEPGALTRWWRRLRRWVFGERTKP